MNHVNSIRKNISEGHLEQAESDLETLLLLGPNNLEALKIHASLLATQGHFEQERNIWKQIQKIDDEDHDANEYFLYQQQEDREHFYFTDEMPEGGRRFHLYPRALINASLIGLLGCALFLMFSRLLADNPVWSQEEVVLSTFFCLVMIPWFYILYHMMRGIRFLSVDSKGLQLSSRLRKRFYAWHLVEAIVVQSYPGDINGPSTLWIEPQPGTEPLLSFDMSERTSSLRAKSYFLNEIKKLSSKSIEFTHEFKPLHHHSKVLRF
jgi:hypothetical protein